MARTLGLEMEMPVIRRATGATHHVTGYFETLLLNKQAKGETASLRTICGVPLGVETDLIISSTDNGFNLLESSIGPVRGENGLTRLNALIGDELRDVLEALDAEGATLINFSEHPGTSITDELYYRMRAPKIIYDYWVGYRKWNHRCGIDAKAHNGPTTGVEIETAVRALNVVLGTAPALIALYANSPFESGRLSGFRENRLRIWPCMFSSSRFSSCDMKLQQLPPYPFKNLRDYFLWMFGPGTHMHFIVPGSSREYKEPTGILVVPEAPSVLDFLAGTSWNAYDMADSQAVAVTPAIRHLEFHQFAHFLDARIRYRLRDETIDIGEFRHCMSEDGDSIERLFASHAESCYIEGRMSGANFPDASTVSEGGDLAARSVVISPSAVQEGLLRNPEEAARLLSRYAWSDLAGLRQEAIRHGLRANYKGIEIKTLCREVLETAGQNLSTGEQWMLAYPEFVLTSGKNGADRGIELFERQTGDRAERMKKTILAREAVIPD